MATLGERLKAQRDKAAKAAQDAAVALIRPYVESQIAAVRAESAALVESRVSKLVAANGLKDVTLNA